MDTKNYEIKANNGYSVVKLDTILNFENCKFFNEEIEGLVASKNHILVDCEQVVEIPKDWMKILLKLHVCLKRESKSLRLIKVNHAVLTLLKKEGMDMAFQISKNEAEALREVGLAAPKRTLDTEFINPFLDATMKVLKVQASVEATAGRIFMKSSADQFVADISGVIGIVSSSFNGSVVISFPEGTFLRIISNMLGEEYTTLNKDIIDGAGEITNMIFGQAKIVLNDKGYGINMAIPSIVTGKDHTLAAMTKGPIVVIPFESPAGKFFVEICLS